MHYKHCTSDNSLDYKELWNDFTCAKGTFSSQDSPHTGERVAPGGRRVPPLRTPDMQSLPNCYSGIFYFCQYLHIGAGILSFGGDVFRL